MEDKTLNRQQKEEKKSGIWWVFKRTFIGHSKKTWIWICIFLGVILLTLYLFYKQFTDETWLFNIVINWFVVPMNKLGIWGWIIFIIFMGIQGILLPIPSELVLLSSGMIWSLWEGSIIGIIGSMFAGTITYYISLKGGRPLAEKFVGAENIALVDKYIEKYGGIFIVGMRAFPFMAFDPISYASGLVKIKTSTYLVATFIGSIIRCVFYAFLGVSLIGEGKDINYLIEHPLEMEQFINEGAARFNILFIIIIAVVLIAFLLYQYVLIPYLQRKQKRLN
ncbi:MAG: TVP38/TMEM64 family protein [Promethearchaeota archaeon]